VKDYFSRLSSSERRFVVVVGLVLFLVVNIFWVWPHFSDWGTIRGRIESATATLATFDAAFEKTNNWGIEVEKMQRGGGNVPAEDQAVAFLRAIQTQAAQSGVAVGGNGRLITRTNQFFMEQIQTINVSSGEKQLVDFLYNLGSGDSLVRVRDLSVHPDPAHQQLQANITLIASYQKNAKAPPASKNAPAAKPAPAAMPTTKPVPAAATDNSKPVTPKKQ
jgi:hypothetical protein